MNYEYSDTYWDDYKRFIQLVEEIVKLKYSEERLIQLYKSPGSIIDHWKEVVESGEDYHFTIFEWDDDTSVRELIEEILNNEEIKKIDYFYKNFKSQIDAIDNHLRRITLDDYERMNCENWWERLILKGGEDEYKENVMTFYKIDLDNYKDE